ncbi:NAD(P)/FAD-dependent oxidoreductase [Mycobacterium asiaticum]|uniref:Pyridine nucleotide-disulfide oxidoreductase n=1 Tax=Mycobacterium asiaticum TaxID=1790 RepID=A0A1A3NA54_MYCAS|nr:NAD(P)/FAD-dependent oxidoreductase [Mycobacterium asiaticum]OBK17929.1 pyridine nucleotide-disulfide oxidoreductase [Mycobacterium asiaticum]
MSDIWDCVIAGGGAAGLSAALVLGRARRRTLLIDQGEQSNRSSHGIGGLLGHDGRPPTELYSVGRTELAKYPSVDVLDTEIIGAQSGFVVELADGRRERSRTVLLATGMKYRWPRIPGLDELWGRSVFHCPFCHGWEVRDRPLAVVANGERAIHSALLLRGWSADIVILTNGRAAFDSEQYRLLDTAGMPVDERPIAEFRSFAGELAAIVFRDGSRIARAGALVETTMHQCSTLVAQLGVVVSAASPVATQAVVVDAFQRTSVPGVFAAGDIAAQMPQVAAAVSSGSLAGAAIVQALLNGDVGLPTPPWPTFTERGSEHAAA